MPADFECSNCHFEFELGPYHHQNGWRTFMICLACGTPYLLAHDFGRERVLMGREGPVPSPPAGSSWRAQRQLMQTAAIAEYEGEEGHVATLIGSPELMEELGLGPELVTAISAERRFWRNLGVIGAKDLLLDTPPCRHCGKELISGGWPSNGAPCPLCNERIREPKRRWIT